MKKLTFLFIAAICLFASFSSCRKADEIVRNKGNELADIYATLDGMGSSRLFEPRYSANNDTIYFDIPYYYPVNSDNEVDLSKIIIRSTVPADAMVSPALGLVMDVSEPFILTITPGQGEKRSFVVVSERIGDVSVVNAKITLPSAGQEIDAIINNSDIIFYVVPGTDISGATLSYEINKHSNASIASGAPVDLTSNIPFTVTGIDGKTKTYTLKALEPVKLDYGAGINRRLWVKSASDLGFQTDMETAIAVSGDYLVLVTRTNPSRYRVYNRFTGEYVKDLPIPFTELSFQVAEDASGNLLGASWAPKNSKFYIYKWRSPLDPNPVKLIDWTNNNPAGITGDGGVGRRLNIYGDLDNDAVIMATAGQSTIIYKWIVAGGQLVSNTPEVINYRSITGGSSTYMGYYAEAQPISTDPNTNYFLNYQFEIALVNGTSHERMTGFANETSVFGIFHMPTAYTTFNNANYLAIVKYVGSYDLNRVHMSLFDVTETSKISLSASDPRFSSFNIYNSEEFTGTKNGNGTADICVAFSPDKERMQVYTLLTNGGIMAHEFTKYAP